MSDDERTAGTERVGTEHRKEGMSDAVQFHDGLRNGAALFLPYDQGLKHGPRDLFANRRPAIRATSSDWRRNVA